MAILDASTPAERFQLRFERLVPRARELVDQYAIAFARRYPGGGVSRDLYPAATVSALMLAAAPLYEAGLVSLLDPATAPGALALLRSVLEAFAHLYFIEQGTTAEERVCRSLRLERGMFRTMKDTVSWATVQPATEAERAQLALKEQRLEGAFAQCHCTGSDRTYSDTSATIKQMVADPRYDGWLKDAYKGSSLVVHVTAWQWLVGPGKHGPIAASGVRPSIRAAWLRHLIVLWAATAQTALVVVDASQNGDELHRATHTLLDDTLFSRASDYD